MLNLKALFTKILNEGIFKDKVNQQMTGSLKTSFNSIEALGSHPYIGSYTVANLLTELSGKYQIGTVYINTAYSKGIVIPVGDYHYISFNGWILLQAFGEKTYIVTSNYVAQIQPINIQKGTITQGTETYYKLAGTSGTHYYWIRQGNKVTVNLVVSCVSASSSMQKFATGLPKPAWSQVEYFALGCQTVGTYRPIWAQINTDGSISASLGTAGQAYYGSVCYTCQ